MRSTMMRDGLSLNDLLERAGRLHGESQLVSRLPDKSLVRHSFAQYYQRTRRLASALLAAGLQKGERVATLCWNHHVHLECYFGIPAAGGVMHTLNLRLAPDDIAWIANHAKDRFLIVDDILLPLYEQIRAKTAFEKVFVVPFSGKPVPQGFASYEDFLAGAPEKFSYVPHDENDPVSMCYTSGTTGRPKGVVYSHRSTIIHTLVGTLPDYWGLSAKSSVMPATPMFHANCWGIPYACVMLGIKMIFPGPHLHPEDLLDLMAKEQPSYVLGVPTIWMAMAQLLESDPQKYRLPPGVRMLVGGAAMPESLIRTYAKHGAAVTQGWGMTETSPLGSVSYLKPNLQGLSEDEKFKRYASAGIPVPLVGLRIIGNDGSEQPWDGVAVGEIQVRGPFITGSYHEVPPEPEKFSADGWLRTGDVAAIDRQGYIRIADRTKDLIKSGGEWISSVDMENRLMGHVAVQEAAVIAIADAKWGERPLACVVLKPGRKASAEELRAHLAGAFAKWQLPDRFEFLEAIPRTSTGKFWKVKLREMFR